MPKSNNNAALNLEPTLSVEDLALRSGIRAEHVLLEGDEILESSQDLARRIRVRFGYRDPLSRSIIKLAVFDDGMLGVRETRRGEKRRERLVNLRHLDPRPLSAKRIAKGMLKASIACAAAGGATLLVGYLGAFAPTMYWLGIALVFAAAVSLAVFILRSDERIAFRTMHGEVVVLTVVAHLGCHRRARAMARKLSELIRETQRRDGLDKQQLLRGEMREHYRLSETGFLSDCARTRAVRKILARFD